MKAKKIDPRAINYLNKYAEKEKYEIEWGFINEDKSPELDGVFYIVPTKEYLAEKVRITRRSDTDIEVLKLNKIGKTENFVFVKDGLAIKVCEISELKARQAELSERFGNEKSVSLGLAYESIRAEQENYNDYQFNNSLPFYACPDIITMNGTARQLKFGEATLASLALIDSLFKKKRERRTIQKLTSQNGYSNWYTSVIAESIKAQADKIKQVGKISYSKLIALGIIQCDCLSLKNKDIKRKELTKLIAGLA